MVPYSVRERDGSFCSDEKKKDTALELRKVGTGSHLDTEAEKVVSRNGDRSLEKGAPTNAASRSLVFSADIFL